MKKTLLLLSLLSTTLLYGQNHSAPVLVTVTNITSKPYVKDKVLFVGKKTGKVISGVTNSSGQFKVQLPDNDTYDIKVAIIGDELKYNTLEIPKLPEGAEFQQMELAIMYELPSSFILANLTYNSGSAIIQKASYKVLDQFVDYLKRKPTIRVRVIGHTDNVGDPTANIELSRRRAGAVRAYLIENGISSSRVVIDAKGDQEPIADNSTSTGRAKNRRTEINIIE